MPQIVKIPKESKNKREGKSTQTFVMIKYGFIWPKTNITGKTIFIKNIEIHRPHVDRNHQKPHAVDKIGKVWFLGETIDRQSVEHHLASCIILEKNVSDLIFIATDKGEYKLLYFFQKKNDMAWSQV